jgi:hypothetical protein
MDGTPGRAHQALHPLPHTNLCLPVAWPRLQVTKDKTLSCMMPCNKTYQCGVTHQHLACMLCVLCVPCAGGGGDHVARRL